MKHPRKPLFPELIGQWPTTFFLYEIIIWGLAFGIPIALFYRTNPWIQILFILLWICLLWGSFLEPRRLKIKELHIHDSKFPKLRIALLSDIHVGPYKKAEWVSQCVERINHTPNIDMVLLPGDFVFGGSQKYASELKPLRKLKCPMRFAVLGNHDHDPDPQKNMHQWPPITSILDDCHINELKNDKYFWKEKGLWILGVDDNYWGHDDLQKTFKGVDHHPKILLAHSPDILTQINALSLHPDIIISGHTHGGQVRLPLLGAVPQTIPTNGGRSHQNRVYKYERGHIIVSRGVGETGVRARFFNPPEIIILNIH